MNTVFIQKDLLKEHPIDDVTLIKPHKVLKPTSGRIFACPPLPIRQSVNLPLCMFALFASDLNPFGSWLTQGKRSRITSPRRPHPGGKCRLCSAQPVRCPKISTNASIAGDRHDNGRFVQWCSTVYQRNRDRTAGPDQLSDSWMG